MTLQEVNGLFVKFDAVNNETTVESLRYDERIKVHLFPNSGYSSVDMPPGSETELIGDLTQATVKSVERTPEIRSDLGGNEEEYAY